MKKGTYRPRSIMPLMTVAVLLAATGGFDPEMAIYEGTIKAIDKFPRFRKSKLGSKLRDSVVGMALSKCVTSSPVPLREPVQTEVVMAPEKDERYDFSKSPLNYGLDKMAEARPNPFPYSEDNLLARATPRSSVGTYEWRKA